MTFDGLVDKYGQDKAEWIADECANALNAGSFATADDPALLAYAERGYERYLGWISFVDQTD